MKTIACDVCGMVLDSKTRMTNRHVSNVFGYDLCESCKEIERNMDWKKAYLEKLKEVEKNDERRGD